MDCSIFLVISDIYSNCFNTLMFANWTNAVIVPITIAKEKEITVNGIVIVNPGINILKNESKNNCILFITKL